MFYKLNSNLIKTLKVESNARLSASNSIATFVDGCLAYKLAKKGTVVKFVQNFVSYIYEKA